MIKDIPVAFESPRAAVHGNPPVDAVRVGPGIRRGLGVERDVIRNEKVEAPVAVIIKESAARSPPARAARYARFRRNVGERPVAIVVVQDVVPPVGHEEVFKPVVIVISDANALTPTVADQAGFIRHVGEGPVAVIVEEMVRGLLTGGKAREPRSVDQKNIQPAVVIVIEEGDAAARSLEDVSLALLSPEIVSNPKPCAPADITEAVTESV